MSAADNLVFNDLNGSEDVFAWHASSATIEIVSTDSAGIQGDSRSDGPSVSADGRRVVYVSTASNLSNADGTFADLFLRDLSLGTTELVSLAADGGPTDGGSSHPVLSDDARFVAFESSAGNLVGEAVTKAISIYVRDRQRGLNRNVAVRTGGIPSDQGGGRPAIDAEGTTIVFESLAGNLDGGGANTYDIFAHDVPVGVAASWTNYGVGFPGTLGIPTLTSAGDPVLATGLDVDVGNSSGRWTLGLLLAGVAPAQIPTNFGGDLLVEPLLWLPFAMVTSGTRFSTPVPYDPAYSGIAVYAQVLQLDDAAARGWAFTPGLELRFGF